MITEFQGCGSEERDAETGNDDFGARYYASRLGRWLSADWSAVPAPVPYANLSNPQTLNLYAMVSDNPETFADLDGHEWNLSANDTCGGQECTGQNSDPGSVDNPAQSNPDGKPQNPPPPPPPLTVRVVDAWYGPSSLPLLADATPLTVMLSTRSQLPGDQATVEAKMSFENEKPTKGGLVLNSLDAQTDVKVRGKTQPSQGGTNIAVRVLPTARDGNFGGSGKGFILFTVTDSKGHALHARLDVEIKSQHFPKAAEHTVGPKDFNQRVVIPINQPE